MTSQSVPSHKALLPTRKMSRPYKTEWGPYNHFEISHEDTKGQFSIFCLSVDLGVTATCWGDGLVALGSRAAPAHVHFLTAPARLRSVPQPQEIQWGGAARGKHNTPHSLFPRDGQAFPSRSTRKKGRSGWEGWEPVGWALGSREPPGEQRPTGRHHLSPFPEIPLKPYVELVFFLI